MEINGNLLLFNEKINNSIVLANYLLKKNWMNFQWNTNKICNEVLAKTKNQMGKKLVWKNPHKISVAFIDFYKIKDLDFAPN